MKTAIKGIGWITALLVVMFLTTAGCRETNPGVEAGNPDLSGHQLWVAPQMAMMPQSWDEEYLVTFVDEDTATVDQILQSGAGGLTKYQTVLERVTVAYQISNNVLTLDASFSNGRVIGISAQVTDAGEIPDLDLTVDGEWVAVNFEFYELISDESGSGGGASLIPSDFNTVDGGRSHASLAAPVLPRPKR